MAFKNTCCCCDLAAGTEAIGWFGISIILLQLIGVVSHQSNSAVSEVNDGGATFQIIGSFIELFLCGYLVAEARQRSICMLLPWLIVNTFGFIFVNIEFISLINAENARKIGGSAKFFIIILVITDLIYGYFLLVVSSLCSEIKQQKRATKEEISHV